MHISAHVGLLASIHLCSAANTQMGRIQKSMVHRLFVFNQLLNPFSSIIPPENTHMEQRILHGVEDTEIETDGVYYEINHKSQCSFFS